MSTINVNLAVTADTQQAKAQLQQLQTTLQKLSVDSSNLKIGVNAADIQKASMAATELAAHLQQATTKSGTLDFSKFNSSITSSGKTLQQYGDQLLKLGPQGQQAFQQLAQSVAQSEIPIKRLSNLFGDFGKTLANTVKWQISSSMIHGFMGSIQHAMAYAQDLNESLNKIQIVTQQSDAQMAKFAETANKAAKALSTTTTTYTDAALIYYQQGLSAREVEERTNVTIKMANAAGVSAKTVSDQMTAVWNNFADGSKSLEYYADVMTALGAATASSTDEISAGLEKFAAVADTVGLSYENAAAALATITATTRQSADSVGTGLRTLFSRLQSVSLGKTLEDGVNLTKYSSALEKIGVSVLDTNGQLRSMDNILEDMGARWNQLNDSQKTALAQTVGGVRQYTTLIALMDNFDFYKQNQQVALGSEGTVQKQADTYAKSWAAAQKRVKASAEAVYSDIINDEFFIKLNDTVAKLLDTLDNLIDRLGGVRGILLNLGGIGTKIFSNELSQGVYKFGVGIRDLFSFGASAPNARNDFLQYAANQYTKQSDLNYLDPSRNIQGKMLATQMQLQSKFGEVSGFMTPQQRLAAQMSFDQLSKIQNQYDVQRVTARNAHDTRTNYQADQIYAHAYADSAIYRESFQKNIENPLKEFTKLSELFSDFQEQGTNDVEGIDNFKKTIKTVSKLFSSKDIDDLFSNIETSGESTDLLADLRTKFNEKYNDNIVKFLDDADIDSDERKNVENRLRGKFRQLAETDFSENNKKEKLETSYNETSKKVNDLLEGDAGVKAAQGITQMAQSMMSFMAASEGIENIAQAIDDMHKGTISASDGWKKLATNGVSSIMQLSMAFSSLKQALTLLNLASGPAGWIAAALTGIATVLPIIKGIYEANRGETDTERLERLTKEADQAETAARNAKDAYESLLSQSGSHNELLKTLDTLTEGTLEFKDALLKANDIAREIIDTHQLLYGTDWYVDDKSIIRFKKGAIDRAEELQMQRRESASQVSAIASARESVAGSSLNQYQDIKDSLTGFSNEATRIIIATFIDAIKREINPTDLIIAIQDIYSGSNSLTAPKKAYDFLNHSNLAFGTADTDTRSFLMENITDLNEIISGILKNVTNNAVDSLDGYIDLIEGEIADRQASGSRNIAAFFQGLAGKRGLGDNAVDQALISQLVNEEFNGSYLNSINNNEKAQAFLDNYAKENNGHTINLLQAYKLFIDPIAEGLTETSPEVESAIANLQLAKEWTAKYDELSTLYYEQAGKYYTNTSKLTLSQLKQNKGITAILQEQGASQEIVNAQLQAQKNAELEQAQAEADFLNEIVNIWDDTTLSNFLKNDNYKTSIASSTEFLNNLTTQAQVLTDAFGKETSGMFLEKYTKDVLSGGTIYQGVLDNLQLTGIKVLDIFNFQELSKKFGINLTNEIQSAIQNAGGISGMLGDLLENEDFQKGELKNLQKILKKTGKIGASDIDAIAESSEELAAMLDLAGISAETLGELLTEVELGNLNVDDLTDGLLNAANAANEVQNNLGEVFSRIDNFQAERSVRDIGKWYKDLIDSIQESQEAGFFFDNTVLQGWEELFGSEGLQEYIKWAQYITSEEAGNLSPQEIEASFKSTFEKQLKAMQMVQKYGDLSGLYYLGIDKNQKNAIDTSNLSEEAQKAFAGTEYNVGDLLGFNEQTGQVITKNDELFMKAFAHQKDFVQFLQDNLHVSKENAQAMAAEYAATDTNLGTQWNIEAAQEGLDNFRKMFADGNEIVTKAQYDFFKKYNATWLSMADSDWEEKFFKELEEAGQGLIDLGDNFDYTETSYEKLKNTMTGANHTLNLDQYEAFAKTENGITDLNKLIGLYERLGYSTEQAYAVITDKYQDNYDGTQLMIQGEEKQINLIKELKDESSQYFKEYQEFLASTGREDNFSSIMAFGEQLEYEQKLKNAANIMADTLKTTFADFTFTIKFDANTGELYATLKEVAEKATTDGIGEGADNAEPGTTSSPISSGQQAANIARQQAEEAQKVWAKLQQDREKAAANKAANDLKSDVADLNNQITELQTTLENLQTATDETTKSLASAMDEEIGKAKGKLDLYETALEQALEAVNNGNIEEAQALIEEAKGYATAAEESATKAKLIQTTLEELNDKNITNLETINQAIENGKITLGDAAQDEINRANKAVEEAKIAAKAVVEAAGDADIETMQELVDKAIEAANKAEMASQAAAGAVLVQESEKNESESLKFTGPSEGATEEEKSEHYRNIDFISQYAKYLQENQKNENGLNYSDWQAFAKTISNAPDWNTISNFASTQGLMTGNEIDVEKLKFLGQLKDSILSSNVLDNITNPPEQQTTETATTQQPQTTSEPKTVTPAAGPDSPYQHLTPKQFYEAQQKLNPYAGSFNGIDLNGPAPTDQGFLGTKLPPTVIPLTVNKDKAEDIVEEFNADVNSTEVTEDFNVNTDEAEEKIGDLGNAENLDIDGTKDKIQELINDYTTYQTLLDKFKSSEGPFASINASEFSAEGAPIAAQINAILDKWNTSQSQFEEAGRNASQGLANGISDGIAIAVAQALLLGTEVLTALQSALQEASPSEATQQMGQFLDEGLAIGLRGGVDSVIGAAKEMATTVLNTIEDKINEGAIKLKLKVNPESTEVSEEEGTAEEETPPPKTKEEMQQDFKNYWESQNYVHKDQNAYGYDVGDASEHRLTQFKSDITERSARGDKDAVAAMDAITELFGGLENLNLEGFQQILDGLYKTGEEGGEGQANGNVNPISTGVEKGDKAVNGEYEITKYDAEGAKTPEGEYKVTKIIMPEGGGEQGQGSSTETTVDSSGMEDFSEAATDAKDAVTDVASGATNVNTQATALGNNQGFHKFVYEAGAAGGQLNAAKKALAEMAEKITKLGNSAESLDMQPFTGPILEASTTLQNFIDLIKGPEVKEGEEQPETPESQTITISVVDNGTIASAYNRIVSLGALNPRPTVTVNADTSPAVSAIEALSAMVVTVQIHGVPDWPAASGLNNGNGQFARGKHSGNDYWGLATVGELGPELMIHRGMPYLAGIGGRTKAYIEPGDTVYTAAETQKILDENPTLQDIPGFSVGYNRIKWGNSGGGGYGSGAKEKNRKTKDFDPERYHLITRQLADITRRYDRLDKIKDKAFGKNKVDAIQAEIDVTNDLIKAQDQLIKEAEDYRNKDLQRLKDLGISYTLDEHGNLENFEELQERYGRAAAEDSENETAKEQWKAIQQYEETIDKLNEANEQMDDYIFQLQELQLEKITTAVDMKIDYDDKSLDLLQHYLDKIKDDIYATADAFQIVGAQIDTTIHQINSAYKGIENILKELHDQNGNQLDSMTIADFLALSPEERDKLLANSEDMEKIVDYIEQIIKFDEELEEKKLFGVEQLSKGFEQLNDNLENTIDLYGHYDNLYNSIRDISDLQGAEISKQSQALLKTLNQNILNNNLNNVRAQQQYYQSLQANRKALENMLAKETDNMIAKEIRKQIDDIDSSLRDAQEELLSLWQEGLQMARDEFERAIEEAVNVYNMALSGMYQTIKRLEDTYSRKKEIQDEYLEDYEKYYQLSKLERDINGTIDNLAASGMKNNKGLARVLKEVNDAQKSGAELSQYDLDVLVKKYELEKARAELEEARDAKSIVRLQRDRSGNWGYVYTQDEDNIAELEQRYEEALYQYQKLNDSHLEELLDSVMKFQEEMGDQVQDIMTDTELTQEEKIKLIEDLNTDYLAKQEFLFSEINKSMENQGTTYGRAIDLYKGKTSELGDAFIDLNDTWEETLLSQILGIKDLDAYKDTMTKAWNDLLHSTGEALVEYQDTLEKVNEKTGTSTEDFMNDAGSWIEAIGNSSDKTTEKVKVLGQEMITQFDKMAEEAMKWEKTIVPAIQAIVDQTEAFANEMTNAIGLMNEAIDLSDAYLVALHSSRKEVGIEAPYIIDALQDKIVENPEMADIMPMVISTLDTTMRAGGFGLGNLIPATVSDISGGFQQQVEIHAEFPNATDHYEIEEAFNNLVNKATQYANTKTTGMEY